jgi:cell division septation protein DedD
VPQAQDEGFHEIQLNGKQLVFLFMAATVVSVVIFLCGVLVGRGVRAERSAAGDATQTVSSVETTPTLPAAAPASAPPPAGSDPTKAAPPPPADELTYFNRLEKPSAATEPLKPPSEKPIESASKSAPAPPAPKTTSSASASPASREGTPASEPSGSGFVVQIAALNVRSEADAIAKRLTSKGYAAYVMAPSSGTPTVYRVRVGKFTTRREAETIAGKLQKEEQFKPWVTR